MCRYPGYIYNINEDVTRANMKEYDRKKELWYKSAEELYPNYWDIPFRERIKLYEKISEYVGFSI